MSRKNRNRNRKRSKKKSKKNKQLGGGILDNINPLNMRMPRLRLPSIGAPSVETPSVDIPSVELPSVEAPSVEAPSVDISNLEGLSIDGILSIGDMSSLVSVENLSSLSKSIPGFSENFNLDSQSKLMEKMNISIPEIPNIQISGDYFDKLKNIDSGIENYVSGFKIPTDYNWDKVKQFEPTEKEIAKLQSIGINIFKYGVKFFGTSVSFYLTWTPPVQRRNTGLAFCSRCKMCKFVNCKKNEWGKRIVLESMGIDPVGYGIPHKNRNCNTGCTGIWYQPMNKYVYSLPKKAYFLNLCPYCRYTIPMDFWDGNHPKNGRCCRPTKWHETMIEKHKNKKIKNKEIKEYEKNLSIQIGKLSELVIKLKKEKTTKLLEKIKKEGDKEVLNDILRLSVFIEELELTIYKKGRIIEILEKMVYKRPEIKKYDDKKNQDMEENKQDIEDKLFKIFQKETIVLNEYILAIIKYECGDWIETFINEIGNTSSPEWFPNKFSKYCYM